MVSLIKAVGVSASLKGTMNLWDLLICADASGRGLERLPG